MACNPKQIPAPTWGNFQQMCSLSLISEKANPIPLGFHSFFHPSDHYLLNTCYVDRITHLEMKRHVLINQNREPTCSENQQFFIKFQKWEARPSDFWGELSGGEWGQRHWSKEVPPGDHVRGRALQRMASCFTSRLPEPRRAWKPHSKLSVVSRCSCEVRAQYL